jgi:hypothetical protein
MISYRSIGKQSDFSARVVWWLVSAAGFAWALWASVTMRGDLRTSGVLAVDVVIGTLFALVYRANFQDLHSGFKTSIWECLSYGLWITTVFRLWPLGINEGVLYSKGEISADVPYVVMSVLIRFVFTVFLSLPFAFRVFSRKDAWSFELPGRTLSLAVVIAFTIVAGIVRLFAELH